MNHPFNKKFYSSFLKTGVLLLLLWAALLPAQEPKGLITRIQIHSNVPLPVRIEPGAKFRNRVPDAGLQNDLKQMVISRLQEQGFYLAQVDSLISQTIAQNKIVMHLYVNTGPRYYLQPVQMQLPDSLSEDIRERIIELAANYSGKVYTPGTQQMLLNELVGVMENNGYPLAVVETREFILDSLQDGRQGITLFLKIIEGPQVRLENLRIRENPDISVPFLQRSIGFKRGELFREKRVRKYRQRLQRLDFIRSAGEPELYQQNDSLFYLFLPFEKSTTTAFDGIVGYIPPPANQPAQSGYFTGELNIGLKNIFGTGRRLDVFWQKPDRYSDEFRVKYREPFLLGLPFHAGGEMYRLVRDTTFIEWQYALNAEVPLNENLSGLFRIYRREVYPDSLASEVLRLPQTRSVFTQMGFQWDSRDNSANPRGGMRFSVLLDYGTQKNTGPDFLLTEDSLTKSTRVTRVNGEWSLFLETWKKQVISFDAHSVLIGHRGQGVRLPDLFWFGGATTIRGYREDQFFADRVAWINNEYRFLLGPVSRFFVFADVGYYSRKLPRFKEEFLAGYGVGVRFPGPLGALQVDYGLAKGLPFQEGKIHVRLINEF
ncbi:MAG: BamA/TamA family outer membrane protein [Calditrichia bacterium]